jgi:hypothetical protein
MRKPLWEVLLEAFVNAERFYCREYSSSVLSHKKGGSCLFVLYIEWATCRRSSKSGRLVGRKISICGEMPWQLQVVAHHR